MQLTYVFSELATGLRRNVTATVAVIVTMFVSLTLLGLGLLLNFQAQKAEEYWGNRLQIAVVLCAPTSPGARCIDGRTTEAQKAQVRQVLQTNPEVESVAFESRQEAYRNWLERNDNGTYNQDQIVEIISAEDLPETFMVTLKDPRQFAGVTRAVQQLDGVNGVRDLREVLAPIYFWISALKYGAYAVAGCLLVAAILQVGNTIRLAALARRREIGIMRLVGASSLYIQLPFLLEALFAAVLGVLLAAGALTLFLYLVVERRLRPNSTVVAWVDWSDGLVAVSAISVVGLALTLVPTLLLTRKYLRV